MTTITEIYTPRKQTKNTVVFEPATDDAPASVIYISKLSPVSKAAQLEITFAVKE